GSLEKYKNGGFWVEEFDGLDAVQSRIVVILMMAYEDRLREQSRGMLKHHPNNRHLENAKKMRRDDLNDDSSLIWDDMEQDDLDREHGSLDDVVEDEPEEDEGEDDIPPLPEPSNPHKMLDEGNKTLKSYQSTAKAFVHFASDFTGHEYKLDAQPPPEQLKLMPALTAIYLDYTCGKDIYYDISQEPAKKKRKTVSDAGKSSTDWRLINSKGVVLTRQGGSMSKLCQVRSSIRYLCQNLWNLGSGDLPWNERTLEGNPRLILRSRLWSVV
ncbi:hypothetical protein HDV05_008699, partial [Chytridiales sp. JEL 0842]